MFPTFSVTTASVFSALDRKNQPGPVRTAKSYELELYLADGEVAYFGSDAYPIRKGTMLFAKPGECRHTVGNFCCRYVHFHCRDRDFAAAYLDTLPTSAALGGSFRCEALMEKLSELFWEKSRTVELRTESILLELIAEFTESAVAPNVSSSEVATESETEAEIRTGAPASPGKRPGVDNNPVEPPKTPDSETEAPPAPSGPETEPPGKGSREGNELPPLWVPAEGT